MPRMVINLNRQILDGRLRARQGRGAFTLVEILIVVVILGILATIVVPQMSSASKEARENTLRDDLRYLRTQIEVFRAQHRDIAPGYPAGNSSDTPTESDFVDQMTKYTSELAATSATSSSAFKFGPYLSRVPENPLNSSSKIKVIGNGAALPAPDASEAGLYGWIYKPATQEIIANSLGTDSANTPYTKY